MLRPESMWTLVLRCPMCGAVIDYGIPHEAYKMMKGGYDSVDCNECDNHFLVPMNDKFIARGKSC